VEYDILSDIDTIRGNLETVGRRIAAACGRSGRDPDDVCLIGVTKRKNAEVAIAACGAGLIDLGENYAQELVDKAEVVAGAGETPRWHFIGGLQSNKVRSIVGLVSSIHSVDRPSLVKELARRVPEDTGLEVYVQVAIAGEEQKSGVALDGVEGLCRRVMDVPSLTLKGLMCVPPLQSDPEASRPHFRALREIRDRLLDELGAPSGVLEGLSMGMTHDIETAVEEGSTVVRVGTALFGSRD